MKISVTELIEKIDALKELQAFAKEIDAEITGYENEIKAIMNEEGVETLSAGKYVVRNTPVKTMRFDTKKFKEEFGTDIYAEFCKEVDSVRFSIV